MTWLLCGFVNVLAHSASNEERLAAVNLAGCSDEELLAKHWTLQSPFDASLSLRKLYTSLARDPSKVDQLIAMDIAAWTHPKADVLAALQRAQAHKGYRLALFSNAPEEYVDVFDRLPWLSGFEYKFVSSLVGAKPSPTAFIEVCRRLGARPEDVTFMDDLGENVNAAAAVGMKAIHFVEAAQIEHLPKCETTLNLDQ
jgi:putative hydrolase of the HAD superfamily